MDDVLNFLLHSKPLYDSHNNAVLLALDSLIVYVNWFWFGNSQLVAFQYSESTFLVAMMKVEALFRNHQVLLDCLFVFSSRSQFGQEEASLAVGL